MDNKKVFLHGVMKCLRYLGEMSEVGWARGQDERVGADPRPVLEVEAGVGGQVGGGGRRLGRPRAQSRILLLQGVRQHQRVPRPAQAELKQRRQWNFGC